MVRYSLVSSIMQYLHVQATDVHLRNGQVCAAQCCWLLEVVLHGCTCSEKDREYMRNVGSHFSQHCWQRIVLEAPGHTFHRPANHMLPVECGGIGAQHIAKYGTLPQDQETLEGLVQLTLASSTHCGSSDP